MEAQIGGTAVFDRLRTDPRVWHFAFHTVRDLPEMLVAGRERQYLQAFYNVRCFDPSAISEADLDLYASAYAAPGAMRAGFDLYRAFDQDRRGKSDRVHRRPAGVSGTSTGFQLPASTLRACSAARVGRLPIG